MPGRGFGVVSAIWKERPEAGNALALRLILWIAFGAGRTMARAVLYPAALYFLMRRGPERRASQHFLARVTGRRASLYQSYRHILCFSFTVLDRVYLLTERFRRFDIHCAGLADLNSALDEGRGVLLIGTHLGSFEALRALSLQRPQVPIRILLDVAQSPTVMRTLNALNPAMAATIIDVREAGPTVTIAIKQALDENAIVALLADRARPGENVRYTDFLGDAAPLPVGPWLLAAALKVPVVLAFGLYRGGNRYDLHFERFCADMPADRAQRESALPGILERFAGRMAHYARLAPYNWFNFYDFWSKAAADSVSVDAGDLLRRS